MPEQDTMTRSYDEHLILNQQTSALLLCKEAFVTAAVDQRLQRTHLRVLAAISLFIGRTTEAWPSRKSISIVLGGLSLKTVSNTITELRSFGYLVTTRKPVEQAEGKRLTVYTFGNIDHDTIRKTYGNLVTNYVFEYRASHLSMVVAQVGPQPDEVPLPRGTVSPGFPPGGEISGASTSPSGGKFPPQGDAQEPKVPAQGGSSPQRGRRNKDRSNTGEEDSAPNGAGGAGAPPPKARTLREVIWDEALGYLKEKYTDSTDKDIRSQVAKIIKDHGRGMTLEALDAAQKNEAVDPLTYIRGLLKKVQIKPESWSSDRDKKNDENQGILKKLGLL